jgi:sensor domain CHASE-containing protein
MLHPLRTLVIAAVVLLPLAAFAVIMVVLFGTEQQRSVEALLHQAVTSAVTALEHRLADDVAVLEALATAHALDDGDFATFYDLAQRALRAVCE